VLCNLDLFEALPEVLEVDDGVAAARLLDVSAPDATSPAHPIHPPAVVARGVTGEAAIYSRELRVSAGLNNDLADASSPGAALNPHGILDGAQAGSPGAGSKRHGATLSSAHVVLLNGLCFEPETMQACTDMLLLLCDEEGQGEGLAVPASTAAPTSIEPPVGDTADRAAATLTSIAAAHCPEPVLGVDRSDSRTIHWHVASGGLLLLTSVPLPGICEDCRQHPHRRRLAASDTTAETAESSAASAGWLPTLGAPAVATGQEGVDGEVSTHRPLGAAAADGSANCGCRYPHVRLVLEATCGTSWGRPVLVRGYQRMS
jgi:hypothetical protein